MKNENYIILSRSDQTFSFTNCNASLHRGSVQFYRFRSSIVLIFSTRVTSFTSSIFIDNRRKLFKRMCDLLFTWGLLVPWRRHAWSPSENLHGSWCCHMKTFSVRKKSRGDPRKIRTICLCNEGFQRVTSKRRWRTVGIQGTTWSWPFLRKVMVSSSKSINEKSLNRRQCEVCIQG